MSLELENKFSTHIEGVEKGRGLPLGGTSELSSCIVPSSVAVLQQFGGPRPAPRCCWSQLRHTSIPGACSEEERTSPAAFASPSMWL